MRTKVFACYLFISVVLLNACSRDMQTACPTFKHNNSLVHYSTQKHAPNKELRVASANKQKNNSVTTAYLDAEPIAKPEATIALVPLQLNTTDAIQIASTQAVIDYMPTKISVVEKENNSVTEKNIATTPVTNSILLAQNAIAAKVNTMSDAQKTKATQRLDKLVKKHEQRQAKIANKNVNKQTLSPENNMSGHKSQLLATLLAFFLGILGIHRFYLGYTLIGLIQLFTFGGFFIWFLIDLVRIIINDLRPIDGRYDDLYNP
jgi:TM2 domain-containing membrane protein YozV